MSTGERGRVSALDGLRGVAVLLVVLHHAEVTGFSDAGGIVGVTVFFTLSGYLITSLLLRERERSGRIDLRAFYVRRARRLLPALAAFLVVMAALGLASAPAVTSVALYVSNWPSAMAGNGALGGLTHTWSLAIEEQFYLVWPVVVVVVASRWGVRVVAAVAVCGAALSAAARLLLWDGGAGVWRVYFGSDTRADALLIGCALAAVLHGRARISRPLVARWCMAALLALVATSGLFAQYVVGPTLVALLTAAVIASAPAEGWLSASWLTLIGQRSYALYLWHFPLIFLALPALPVGRALGLPLVLAAAWGVTLLSWRYVEAPFLRGQTRPVLNGLRSLIGGTGPAASTLIGSASAPQSYSSPTAAPGR